MFVGLTALLTRSVLLVCAVESQPPCKTMSLLFKHKAETELVPVFETVYKLLWEIPPLLSVAQTQPEPSYLASLSVLQLSPAKVSESVAVVTRVEPPHRGTVC